MDGDGLGIFKNEPGTWPDGEVVHPYNIFVKLICGHHRVSSGWRGSAGEKIFCEACSAEKKFGLKLIMATIVTNKDPYDWHEPERDGQMESAEDFLKRVEARAKELYAISDQGDWDDLEPWMQQSWINSAGRELRGDE